ncbi:MAG: hypothetical protein H0X51_07820 [Parachlamydiaceae bacterium]|nr:hypothetical protein [Parachlamydiaceae bacterium]
MTAASSAAESTTRANLPGIFFTVYGISLLGTRIVTPVALMPSVLAVTSLVIVMFVGMALLEDKIDKEWISVPLTSVISTLLVRQVAVWTGATVVATHIPVVAAFTFVSLVFTSIIFPHKKVEKT